jgi:Xylanase inhibitor N-terminal
MGSNFRSVLLLLAAAVLGVRACHEILRSGYNEGTDGRCSDHRPRRSGHRSGRRQQQQQAAMTAADAGGGGGNQSCCFSSKGRCDECLAEVRGGRLVRDSLNGTRYDCHPVSDGSTLSRLDHHRRLSHHYHHPLLRGGAGGIQSVTGANPERFSNSTTSISRTAAAAFAVPLESASGTMHVRAFLGEPAQVQIWIVDTGSHLTATSCAPLSRAAPLQHYDPMHSSTHHALTCGMCELSQTSSSGGTLCRRLADGADDDDSGGGDTAAQKKRKCRVTQRYTEGSKWSAYEANDFVTLSTNNQYDEISIRQSTLPFTFGCQTSCTGLFQQQYANGILGLERSSVSYVSQLHKSRLIEHNAFSICTNPHGGGGRRNSTMEDGRMGLGGAIAHRHVSPMQYTSIVHAEAHGMYRVEVQVWLGNDCLVNATRNSHLLEGAFNRPRGKGTVVDSGTTDTFLPSGLADEWEESWFRQTGRPWKRRIDSYTHASFQLLPAVTLHLARSRRDDAGEESAATNNSKGSTLRWVIPPEHYMEASSSNGAASSSSSSSAARRTSSSDHSFPWSGSRIFTNRMYVDEADGAVLGLNAMRGYDVLFDADGQRVGLAPVRAC